MKEIYLGTISMEKNRWENGRIPTFNVSDFIDRIISDGFDGIELWQYHYTSASDEEKAKLASSGIPFIFNSYISFVERNDEIYKEIGNAVKELDAKTIKFNLGLSSDNNIDIATQVENLKRFAEFLPNDVKLLSECHANTIMEIPEEAGEIFAKLDKERYGAIIHLSYGKDFIDRCYAAYGDRITHIHCSYLDADIEEIDFKPLDDPTGNVKDKLNYFINKGFNGTLNVEFVKFEDTAEAHYIHAVEDMKYLRTIYK